MNTTHCHEFLNQVKQDQTFARGWFSTLVGLSLSDEAWSNKSQREDCVSWLTEVFLEVKNWASHPVHADFVARTLHVELGYALMKYAQTKTSEWDSASELGKMAEVGKCLSVLGDVPDLVYFLTVPNEMPKELSLEDIVSATERWHKMTAPTLRARGMSWEVLNVNHASPTAFIGEQETFWWENAKGVSEEQAKAWIKTLGTKNVIPNTPLTCLKSLGSTLLSANNDTPFFSQIEHWKGTPEAKRKALNGGRPTRRGLGPQTPTWTDKERLSAKRVAWHAECLNPSYAQSLPVFEPYFCIPNEFWEIYAATKPHPAWAKIMMPGEWLARIAAVGSIDGGWRTSPGNVLALETDARLRLAMRHPEVDEAVQAVVTRMGGPTSFSLGAPSNQKSNGSLAQSHWERMRLEWKHGKASKPAGPAL